MKRILSFIAAVMFVGQTLAAATTFEIGNLKYTITDETNRYVSVSKGSTAPTGVLEIPSTVTNGSTTYTVTSIGSDGFLFCGNLTSVIIPNTIISIGRYAFSNCSGMTSFAIPNSVTNIGDYAFNNCSGLTSVTIGKLVTSISVLAFYGCSKLTDINVEGDNTKYSSENGVLFNNAKNSLICYPAGKTETTYTIPNSVTNIGEGAFKYCDNLTTINIPNSVTSIGKGAFGYCSALTSVSIGNSVMNISNFAFDHCRSLASITISNSVRSIGEYAFQCCDNLTTINIPNSVTSIGCGAFNSCNKLTEINVESANTKYTSENGVLFNKDKTTIVRYPAAKTGTTYTIPNSVTSIDNRAFTGCSGLTNVFIPNSVTNISEYAFYGCDSLTSVAIPNSVTTIGGEAFSQCKALSAVISNTVKSIGSRAFDNVKNIIYTGSVTGKPWGAKTCGISVDEDGFVYGDANKTQLVDYVGKSSNITTPNSVTDIGSDAFNNCNSLTSVTISNSVTSIGEYAFNYCAKLSSITIPNSVTSIGNYAFQSCSQLTEINVESTNIQYTSDDGVLFNKNKTILIRYPAGKQDLSYTIPDGVKSIGETAFADVNNLPYIVIPNSVTDIADAAFITCRGLKHITIGKGVTRIGRAVFQQCRNLMGICFEGKFPPELGDNWVFEFVNRNIPICVPTNYTAASWCGFNNIHKGHNEVAASSSPSCTEYGLSEGTHCSYCGKLFTAQVIPALGHSYGAPTYTWAEDGSACTATAVCQRDETHVATEDATTTSNVTTAATCLEMGTTTYTAMFENELFEMQTKDVVDVPATGHTADNFVFENQIAATCTSVGSYDSVVYCSVCQVELFREEKEIPTLDHTYSTTVTAPTCTAVGYTTHTCSVCEFTYYSDTVDTKGHKADSVEFENIKMPTCTDAGSKDSVVFCSVCEVEISREEKEIPANGHTYSNSVTKPTCTAVGFTTHTCSVCNHTYNSDTIAANGHTEVVDAAIAATCTAAGKTEGKHCSVCNETIVAQAEIPALGHEFKDYIYNNDATTTADGTETATCTRGCGATDTRAATGTKLTETPEKGTVVAESAANAVTIYAYGNTIIVENATNEISVYNAMGVLVSRDVARNVSTIIVNGTGVYIVKTGSVVKRVMVN